MRKLHTIFLVLLALSSFKTIAQGRIELTPIDLKKLPAGIKYEGELKAGHRWTDLNGDNIAIITETGFHQSKKFEHVSDVVDKEIFAYHFIIKNNKATPTWRVYDYISDCDVDTEANFIPETFRVSDLDKDGYAEVWMLYKTACRGDVSPADMKVIMYENGTKHAMRGTEKVFGGTDEKGTTHYIGGEYTLDPAFANAPESFRAYAGKIWNENLNPSWDDK